MKINRKVCWVITFGHWMKHYPGEKRYVRCRLCGQMPKRGMWETLRRMRKSLKNQGLLWIGQNCILVPFERVKK
jgi:hypothetical protein